MTLPLDVVAAMQNVPDQLSDDEAKAAMSPAMAQAILAAVRTIPFSVASKSAASERESKHDEDLGPNRDEDSISIRISGSYGDVARLSINPEVTVYNLKNIIRAEYGIPCTKQRLSLFDKIIYKEIQLDDLKTLLEVRISATTLCEIF